MNEDILSQYKQIKFFNESFDKVQYISNFLDKEYNGEEAKKLACLFNAVDPFTSTVYTIKDPLSVGVFEYNNINYYILIYQDTNTKEHLVEFGVYDKDYVINKNSIYEEIAKDPDNISMETFNKIVDVISRFNGVSDVIHPTNDHNIIEVMNRVASFVKDKISELHLTKLALYTEPQRARLYMKIINKLITNVSNKFGTFNAFLKDTDRNISFVKRGKEVKCKSTKIEITFTHNSVTNLNRLQESVILDLVDGSSEAKEFVDELMNKGK